MKRVDGRQAGEPRRVVITPRFLKHAEGSVLIEVGDTKVICAATVEEKAIKQIDFAKKSYETAIANTKEIADLFGKSQTVAFEALSARVAELTEEVKAAIAKK